MENAIHKKIEALASCTAQFLVKTIAMVTSLSFSQQMPMRVWLIAYTLMTLLSF